ncbi:MAG TPA: FHA domain-containing protein [Vicinamibacteria bacterium]|nr:FHA domain-containing protein [Vicinamibacteria bacterium]
MARPLLVFRGMSAMEMTAVVAPSQAMVLQLKTDNEVHAFDLRETFRVAVGRHQSNDVQLRSRRVSSYHAEILSEIDGLFLLDMGSTNGTYVNDEAVQRKKLSSGDSIRIGEFTLSVLLVPRCEERAAASTPGERFPVGAAGSILPFRSSSAPEVRQAGLDATLPELLTGISRRSGSAILSVRIHQEGRISLREGKIVHCEYGAVRGKKALYRLMAQERGTYQVLELGEEGPAETIHDATEGLVVEGMQELEALDNLVALLPPMTHELDLDERCTIPVSTLTADEIATYQELIRYRVVGRVLDESKLTDFTVLLSSHTLLQKGFFKPVRSADVPLQETVIKPQSA